RSWGYFLIRTGAAISWARGVFPDKYASRASVPPKQRNNLLRYFFRCIVISFDFMAGSFAIVREA
ncbi:MAG: hypothetical protein LHV69_11630, partial [Elusimicrobia bacterium]|nr:hypothetical protein [Candidatus Obscuribacterium magneticum]